jgi:hypothetical protein
MYYIMSDDDEIIDSMTKCPTRDELDKLAQSFGCDVWVMKGEHTGMSSSAYSKEQNRKGEVE